MPVKQITEAENKYQSGQSLPLIAKDYGASRQTLSHIFKKYKIYIKSPKEVQNIVCNILPKTSLETAAFPLCSQPNVSRPKI